MLLKSKLNQNIHLSEGNIKSRCTDDVIFLTWSLPSRITCPYKTELCSKKCFAKKNETFQSVRDSRQKNLDETKKKTFVKDMIDILEYQLQRKKTKNKKIFVRIHTSGDFYDLEYLDKWIDITDHFLNNNRILFQAYTKSIPILKDFMDEIEICSGYNLSDKEYYNILKDNINIHFVWSIWHDTPTEYTELAKKIGLQTFTALPKDEIQKAVNEESFLCKGDCGNCRQCYTGRAKNIVIPYH